MIANAPIGSYSLMIEALVRYRCSMEHGILMTRKLLFSNASPFARRVRIVLAEKQLPFEEDKVNAVRPIEDIRAHNPALQVPVLYDGKYQLFDSSLILQYLMATYPTLPRPDGEPELSPSMTRPDNHWEDSLTLRAIEVASDAIVSIRMMEGATKDGVPYMARQEARIVSCLDWLEPRCSQEGFWPGTFSIMDINLMCPLRYGEVRNVFDFRQSRWPNITAMYDYWQSRNTVAATALSR